MHNNGDIPMHAAPPFIPPEFQTRVQSLLEALADIDFRT